MDHRYEALLRRLAVLDQHTIDAALPMQASDPRIRVDERTTALVRLAGLVALQSSPQAYEWCVAAALAAGSSEEEVVAVLAALAPVVGVTRVSHAAASVATAIGCRVDDAWPGLIAAMEPSKEVRATRCGCSPMASCRARRDGRSAGVGPPLDDRSRALALLGAVLATGGSPSAYERLVADALAAGVSAEEIIDILIEVAPTIGLARLVPCSVELALALGYDIDRALEEHDDVQPPSSMSEQVRPAGRAESRWPPVVAVLVFIVLNAGLRLWLPA